MPMPDIYCRGGCGQLIDPEKNPAGLCPDCDAREYRKNQEKHRERRAERRADA